MRYLILILIIAFGVACQRATPPPSADTAVDKDPVASKESAEVPAKDVEPAAAAPHHAKTQASGCGGSCGGACGGGETGCGGSCGGACGSGGGCGGHVAVEQTDAKDLPKSTTWSTINVQGMMCGGCERRVIAAVSKIDGVARVEASSKTGEVRIALNTKDRRGVEDQARKSITTLGFATP